MSNQVKVFNWRPCKVLVGWFCYPSIIRPSTHPTIDPPTYLSEGSHYVAKTSFELVVLLPLQQFLFTDVYLYAP